MRTFVHQRLCVVFAYFSKYIFALLIIQMTYSSPSFPFLLYSKLIGFHYYTFCLIPGIIGSSLAYTLPLKIIHIHSSAFCNMLLEATIKSINNEMFVKLRRSRFGGTLLFMLFSSIIMHYRRVTKVDAFWFIKPTHKREGKEEEIIVKSPVIDCLIKTDEVICNHKKSCDAFILNVRRLK